MRSSRSFCGRAGSIGSRFMLPPDEARQLEAAAAAYASAKLAEIDARTHFVNELHHRSGESED
jgi:hypothetical protein